MKKPLLLCSLLLCTILLFTACQKEKERPEKHHHEKEVTEEECTEAPEAEEFIGCWEDFDSYSWVCIYENGTYEIYSESGEICGPYPYELDSGRLLLTDSSVTLEMEESGNLVSSNGETLFKSHLPEPEDTEEETEYTVDEEVQHKFELSEAFSGCWRCDEPDGWIIIDPYSEATYRTYNSAGVEIEESIYEFEGDDLNLMGHGVTLSLMDNGQIYTSKNNVLYRSEMDLSDVRNELLEGFWEYSGGEYVLYFDGRDILTLSTPDSVLNYRYQYSESGLYLYHNGEEAARGDLNNAGNLVFDDMEGFFYPYEE